MELLNMIEIHNRISMNAEEAIGIKQYLKICHALSDQIRRFRHMKTDLIP